MRVHEQPRSYSEGQWAVRDTWTQHKRIYPGDTPLPRAPRRAHALGAPLTIVANECPPSPRTRRGGASCPGPLGGARASPVPGNPSHRPSPRPFPRPPAPSRPSRARRERHRQQESAPWSRSERPGPLAPPPRIPAPRAEAVCAVRAPRAARPPSRRPSRAPPAPAPAPARPGWPPLAAERVRGGGPHGPARAAPPPRPPPPARVPPGAAGPGGPDGGRGGRGRGRGRRGRQARPPLTGSRPPEQAEDAALEGGGLGLGVLQLRALHLDVSGRPAPQPPPWTRAGPPAPAASHPGRPDRPLGPVCASLGGRRGQLRISSCNHKIDCHCSEAGTPLLAVCWSALQAIPTSARLSWGWGSLERGQPLGNYI
ncbi:basic proline-rich protein-like [Manis pentadactyla]|uniref:basic proline-rich protein-like n=1 Tax=Manis pentadactyla TaxID=143292 RepID=UPI00255C5A66|nr:basic proline-rich protein-like [Manis pentadactyla]